MVHIIGEIGNIGVTKNCGVTCVTSKIRECPNFVSNPLAYLISVVSQYIFSCLRLLL